MGIYSNHFKYQLATKQLNLSTDTIKVILMVDGFVFNPDTHSTYANISGDELATGHGYTQNTSTLAGVSIVQDDALNMAVLTSDNVEWTAVGGLIGPCSGVAYYDDTSSDNTVIGFESSATITASEGEKIVVVTTFLI